LYERLGGFNEYQYIHDWDYLLRATLICQPTFVSGTSYKYRIHNSNTFKELESQKLNKKQQVTDVLCNIFAMMIAGEYENKLLRGIDARKSLDDLKQMQNQTIWIR
jgi:hypothetical protein